MNENLIVSLKDIVVEFDGQKVLDGLSLDIHDKEFVTFLGPSGCGKTTTLRVIAGFVTPKSGNVFFDGKDIANMPPYKRPVNTVFQKYALFPHLNVFENVAFGLRLKKMTEDEIRPKVLEMLEIVGLKGFERRSIYQLSAGQQQREAFGGDIHLKGSAGVVGDVAHGGPDRMAGQQKPPLRVRAVFHHIGDAASAHLNVVFMGQATPLRIPDNFSFFQFPACVCRQCHLLLFTFPCGYRARISSPSPGSRRRR